MKKNILLEIERNREIMGLKPFIMEGINLLITESIDPFKLWEKLFERNTETEVEEAITRNSRISSKIVVFCKKAKILKRIVFNKE